MGIRANRSRFIATCVRATGIVAALIGGFWLCAWLGGWARGWSAAGVITVKTNMALGQLLSGIALLLLANDSGDRRWRAAGAAVLAVVVFLIGTLTLSQHLFGIDLGIDQLLASELPGAAATASRNRIGPLGSTCLILLGIGLLALGNGRKATAAYLGIVVCAVGLVPAVGFLYGIRSLYGLPRLTGVAWPTVVALVSLGLGLVMSHEKGGPFAMLLRADAGGMAFRSLLPVAILAPLSLGYLWVQAESLELVRSPADTGLFIIALIMLFSSLLWHAAARLSREAVVADAAREALQESEERLRLAQMAGRIGVWDMNLGSGEVTWTRELEIIYEVEPGDVRSYEDFRRLVHPDDLTMMESHWREAVIQHRGFDVEFRILRPNGEVAWVYCRGGATYEEAGAAVRVFGVNIDITGRMRAENALKTALEAKEVLLKELAHRTKNNMQVISSLLSLQAAASSDKRMIGAVSDIQDRIYAMSLIHEKIYRSGNYDSLGMMDYVRDLVQAILHTHHESGCSIRTDMELEEMEVSIDMALPCGLIINELVSNSLKHAFSGRTSGAIALSLGRSGGEIELTYRDDGPGLPEGFDPSQAKTLGLKLVRNLATLQLRGTMEVKHGPETEFTFRFPR